MNNNENYFIDNDIPKDRDDKSCSNCNCGTLHGTRTYRWLDETHCQKLYYCYKCANPVIVIEETKTIRCPTCGEDNAFRLSEMINKHSPESDSCIGEQCRMCSNDATHKIGEELNTHITYSNLMELMKAEVRHNFTAYVCCFHFNEIFGVRSYCEDLAKKEKG